MKNCLTLIAQFFILTHLTCLHAQTSEAVLKYDGTEYPTLKIAGRVWMNENLRSSKYVDGSEIPEVTGPYSWAMATEPSYCWHENNKATYENFGAYYNLEVVRTGKVCPAEWHVPTLDDMHALIDFLDSDSLNWIKVAQLGFFDNPPGERHYDGDFVEPGYGFSWWCSTSYDIRMDPEGLEQIKAYGITEEEAIADNPNMGWGIYVACDTSEFYTNVLLNGQDKNRGMGIRCVKDEE